MWNFITQPGLTTTVVDFTAALSPLGWGLVGLVVLSAGMITFAAIRHHLSQQPLLTAETTPVLPDYKAAA